MKVIDIIPKEIAILTEFKVPDIEALIFCLERSSVSIDTTDPEQVKKMQYFTEDFFKILVELQKRLENVSWWYGIRIFF